MKWQTAILLQPTASCKSFALSFPLSSNCSWWWAKSRVYWSFGSFCWAWKVQ